MIARRPGVGFAASLGAITLIGPLAIHFFLPVMPEVKASFGISDALVALTFSVALGTMAVVTLIYGTLSDRYGRRPVLLTGLALFVAGSVVSALSGSVAMLILGRLIQAAGAGCGVTLARAIARDAYGPDALVKAIAYLTMFYTIGPMIAPPLGGVLMDAFGWRSVFWFAVIAGSAIAVLAYVTLYETRSRAEIEQQPAGIFRHYAALLGQARFLAYVLQSGFMNWMFFAIVAASPFLMKDLLGRSATEYGLWFSLFPLGYCAGNLVASRLSGRFSIDVMVLTGSLICVVLLAAQAVVILAGYLSPSVIFIPVGVISIAQGLALPNAQGGSMRVLPHLAGTAAGLGVCLQMVLSAASVEAYGLMADGTPVPMIVLSLAGAVLALIAAIFTFATRRPVAPAVTPSRAALPSGDG